MTTIRIEKERVDECITLDDLIGMQAEDLISMRNVLGKFVWNAEDEAWLSESEGRAAVGKMSLKQLREVTKDLIRRLKDSAVPLANGEG